MRGHRLRILYRRIVPRSLRQAVRTPHAVFLMVSSPGWRDRLLWRLHCRWVRVLTLARLQRWRVDPEFAKLGLKRGALSDGAVSKFVDSLQTAATVPIAEGDFAPGYVYNSSILGSYAQDINAGHSFLSLDPEHLRHLGPMLEELERPVAACIGSPWRVVNVRCWKTRPSAKQIGANSWHTDGFPPSVLKIMVYPFGASVETGTTEMFLGDGSLLSLEGPPGTWVLFKNSQLSHRGIAPNNGDRLVVEITLMPSLRSDMRPVFAGSNAQYPRSPWSRSAGP